MTHLRCTVLGFVLVALGVVRPSEAKAPKPEAPDNQASGVEGLLDSLIVPEAAPDSEESVEEPLAWSPDFQGALVQAQTGGKPVLVKFGAEWCGWCVRLDEVMNQPPARDRLTDWVLVQVDIDQQPELARQFRVQGVPALRVLTPKRKLVASADGFLPGEELAAWLQKQRGIALESRSVDELHGDGPPNTYERKVLVRSLDERDPAVRETAIARLIAHPQASRNAVIQALSSERLIRKLSALEVLSAWGAPVVGLDPWRSETMTEERLASLQEWSDAQSDAEAAPKQGLTPAELEEAQELIDQLVQADDLQAAPLLARLRRFGSPLVDAVSQQQEQTDPGPKRERLRELCFWLTADAKRVLDWPAGLRALASSNLDTRRDAAEALAAMATPNDQDLLLSLFGDPDPLVREIALRGLTTRVGPDSIGELTRLLKDPSGNVRAAVLKQLAEAKLKGMSEQIADYVQTETDADLLVYAVRYLKVIEDQESSSAIAGLAGHESWQVRAEVAETLSEIVDDDKEDSYSEEARNRVHNALLELLSDSDAFVVSRALPALDELEDVPVEKVVGVISRHPELAVAAAQRLTSMQGGVEQLIRLVDHEAVEVRVAALDGLQSAGADQIGRFVGAALEDESPVIRAKAAQIVFQACESARELAGLEGPFGRLPDQREGFEAPFGSSLETPFGNRPSSFLGGILKVFSGTAAEAREDEQQAAEPLLVEADQEPVVEAKASDSDREAVDSDAEPEIAEDKQLLVEDMQQGPADPLAEYGAAYRGWLARFRDGGDRPDWVEKAIPKLEALLRDKAIEPRLWGAATLVALRDDQQALELIQAAAEDDADASSILAATLPWINGEGRAATLRLAIKRNPEHRQAENLLEQARKVFDSHTVAAHWELIAERPPEDERWRFQVAYNGLVKGYLNNDWYDSSEITEPMRDAVRSDALGRLGADRSAAERAVALALLLTVDAGAARKRSNEIVNDASTPESLRRFATRVHLISASSKQEADRFAIQVLDSQRQDNASTVAALKTLAFGTAALHAAPQMGIEHLWFNSVGADNYHSGGIRVPKPPKGLDVHRLESLAESPNAEARALAAYFLTLLDKPGHVAQLVEHWRSGANSSYQEPWQRLVYEAIAYADDADRIDDLVAIYEEHYAEGDYRVRAFYWTIRMMTGEKAVAFRKRIRDEIGMDSLN